VDSFSSGCNLGSIALGDDEEVLCKDLGTLQFLLHTCIDFVKPLFECGEVIGSSRLGKQGKECDGELHFTNFKERSKLGMAIN